MNNNKNNNVEMGKDMENVLEKLSEAFGQGFKETLKKLNEEAKAELFSSVEESIQIAREVNVDTEISEEEKSIIKDEMLEDYNSLVDSTNRAKSNPNVQKSREDMEELDNLLTRYKKAIDSINIEDSGEENKMKFSIKAEGVYNEDTGLFQVATSVEGQANMDLINRACVTLGGALLNLNLGKDEEVEANERGLI